MLRSSDVPESALAALLAEGVTNGVFPGAVAAIGTLDGEGMVVACAGTRAPGEPSVEQDTPYDLASLTKPFVAMAALRLSQHGTVDLHEPINVWLPELEDAPVANRSFAELLSHRAGLVPWVALFEQGAVPGAPVQRREMLRAAAWAVADPPTTGRSVYSDLGYLIAGEALARASGRGLHALVEREVTVPLGIDREVFYPAARMADERAALASVVAPTEVCPRRQRELRGEVHDENAHAFGGVAGHAGLFGRAEAVGTFGLAMLRAREGRSRWLDQALVTWALRPRGDGYVIGWDTRSLEGSSAGSAFSLHAFGHLGFTGTSIWCDPSRRLCAVLLTNRVHPTRDNVEIRRFRPRFHDFVAAMSDAGRLTPAR